MLELIDTRSRRVVLPFRALVGRSSEADLRIPCRPVSALHAELLHNLGTWTVKDLASKNGTFVDGRRIRQGHRISLHVGQVLYFGTPEFSYRVQRAGPPQPSAKAPSCPWHIGIDGVLSLPDPRDAEVVIFFSQAEDAWLAESSSGAVPVQDRDEVHVGRLAFRLALPTAASATEEIARLPAPPRLHFEVSRNEEDVHLSVSQGKAWFYLGQRAHHHTVLTLARLKKQEACLDIPTSEQGWVEMSELERMLGIDRLTINTHLHRFRKQLASHGLFCCMHWFERRSGSGQLRLALPGECIQVDGEKPRAATG